MQVSNIGIVMRENAKKSKMLALFNALEEKDKDIVILLTESLVKKCRVDNTTDMTITPVTGERRFAVQVN